MLGSYFLFQGVGESIASFILFRIGASSTTLFGVSFAPILRPSCGLHIGLFRVGYCDMSEVLMGYIDSIFIMLAIRQCVVLF